MSQRILNSRILHKRDVEENWELHNPTLMDGELIIVEQNQKKKKKKIKIGDGASSYSELPFIDETDTTLTQSDVAADAKTVGDALSDLDAKIVEKLKTPPSVTTYRNPTSIPITSGMQIVFYAAHEGTITFTMGDIIYSRELTSQEDTGWMLWVQTGDADGSFIFPSGTRQYMHLTNSISEATITFESQYDNTAYIVLTIE